MFLFKCAQRGCGYSKQVKKLPDECPDCGRAVSFPSTDDADAEKPWSKHTKAELVDVCEAWQLEYNSSDTKAELIELLEKDEATRSEGD